MLSALRVFVVMAVMTSLFGCSPTFNPPPQPAVVSHLDISKKQEQVDSVISTLYVFRSSAQDLRSREKIFELKRLAEKIDNYITLQVKPILKDFEINNNPATRLEAAKLQLMCGFVYRELRDSEWYPLLKEMTRRYGDQPEILNATIDRRRFGASTIQEGMRSLYWRSYEKS